MVNNSLKLGFVPHSWKVSIIIPVQKVKNSLKAEEFRPINTLPIYEQILEQVIKSRLEKYIEDNHILEDEQSGFRKKYSCETALQNSIVDWRQALDNGLLVGVLYIDFTRAFETIHRPTLIKILKEIGIEGVVLDWFKSYLTNRKQKVKFNNILSEEIVVEHGVPQGSKLGPLLFIIYVNTVIKKFKNIGITCKMFADDMKLYYASLYLKEIEMKINKASEILNGWLQENQSKINTKKTVFSILHDQRKINVRNQCNIMINGVKIQESNKVKYLGVIIDDNLNFKDNANQIISKVAKKLDIY